MQLQGIKTIKSLGVRPTLDFEVNHKDHNFYGEGVVISNSHATCYSKLTALTAYLKWAYPSHFFLECIKNALKGQDPFAEIAQIIPELPYFNIKLLPPDLVKSDVEFKLERNDIRFGLGAIKSVSLKSIEKLQSFIDKEKSNKFHVFQAAKESSLNIGILASLIQSGVLSFFGENRPKMVLEAQIYSKLSERERQYLLTNGEKYAYDLINALKDYLNWNDGKAFKESRLDTIRKHTKSYLSIYSTNSKMPRLANYVYEKQLLGFSYSESLKALFIDKNPDLQNCNQIKNEVDKENFLCYCGEVIEVKSGISKKGNKYLRLLLGDETGSINCIFAGDKYARYADSGEIPKEGEICYIEGTKGDDCVFINRLSVQKFEIYFRVGQIKQNESESNQKIT